MSNNARNARQALARKKILRAIGLMTATLGMIVAAGILSLGSTLQQFLEKKPTVALDEDETPPPLAETTPTRTASPAPPPTESLRLAQVTPAARNFSASSSEPYARILNGRPILSVAETAPDSLGNLTRVTVVKTSLKYPLIRVEDRVRRDSPSGEKLLARSAMVADHLMLSLGPEFTEEDLARAIRSLNEQEREAHYEIRRTNPNSRVFLLAFEGSSPQALEQARERIRSSGVTSAVEPDYLVHSR